MGPAPQAKQEGGEQVSFSTGRGFRLGDRFGGGRLLFLGPPPAPRGGDGGLRRHPLCSGCVGGGLVLVGRGASFPGKAGVRLGAGCPPPVGGDGGKGGANRFIFQPLHRGMRPGDRFGGGDRLLFFCPPPGGQGAGNCADPPPPGKGGLIGGQAPPHPPWGDGGLCRHPRGSGCVGGGGL